jgi:hypothetical protein
MLPRFTYQTWASAPITRESEAIALTVDPGVLLPRTCLIPRCSTRMMRAGAKQRELCAHAEVIP